MTTDIFVLSNSYIATLVMRPDGPGAIRRLAREVGMVLRDAAVVNRFGDAGVVEVGDGQPVAVRVKQFIADDEITRRAASNPP